MEQDIPDWYSDEQLDRAVEMALNGETISAIIRALGTNHQRFWLYRERNVAFRETIQRALSEGQDRQVDRLNTILEEYPNVNDARLMSDNIKWTAGKRKPSVYGDKIDVTVQQTVSIRDALEEGKRRAMRDVTPLPVAALAAATGLPPVAADCGAAVPGRSAAAECEGAALMPECVKTALDGPITRRDGAMAPPGAPPEPRRATERYSAKQRTRKRGAPDCDASVTDCGVTDAEVFIDPLS